MTGSNHDAEFARADALAGLARDLDDLRRAVDPLREVSGRVNDLGRLVGQLADSVALMTKRPAATPAPSWLLLQADETVVERALSELCAWLHTIYRSAGSTTPTWSRNCCGSCTPGAPPTRARARPCSSRGTGMTVNAPASSAGSGRRRGRARSSGTKHARTGTRVPRNSEGLEPRCGS